MWNQLPNLAGVGLRKADHIARWELVRARVDIVIGPPSEGEVRTHISGQIGPFCFTRAWRYWVVRGPLPLHEACALYEDPAGREDVRVNGNAGNEDPVESAIRLDPEGRTVYSLQERERWEKLSEESKMMAEVLRPKMSEALFTADPARYPGYILNYHIDSELGLRLFADAARRSILHAEQLAL